MLGGPSPGGKTVRTFSLFGVAQIAIFLVAILLVAAPYMWLGDYEAFILHQHFGISRRQCLKGIVLVIFSVGYYQLLDISPELRKAGWTAVGHSVWQKGSEAAHAL